MDELNNKEELKKHINSNKDDNNSNNSGDDNNNKSEELYGDNDFSDIDFSDIGFDDETFLNHDEGGEYYPEEETNNIYDLPVFDDNVFSSFDTSTPSDFNELQFPEEEFFHKDGPLAIPVTKRFEIPLSFIPEDFVPSGQNENKKTFINEIREKSKIAAKSIGLKEDNVNVILENSENVPVLIFELNYNSNEKIKPFKEFINTVNDNLDDDLKNSKSNKYNLLEESIIEIDNCEPEKYNIVLNKSMTDEEFERVLETVSKISSVKISSFSEQNPRQIEVFLNNKNITLSPEIRRLTEFSNKEKINDLILKTIKQKQNEIFLTQSDEVNEIKSPPFTDDNLIIKKSYSKKERKALENNIKIKKFESDLLSFINVDNNQGFSGENIVDNLSYFSSIYPSVDLKRIIENSVIPTSFLKEMDLNKNDSSLGDSKEKEIYQFYSQLGVGKTFASNEESRKIKYLFKKTKSEIEKFSKEITALENEMGRLDPKKDKNRRAQIVDRIFVKNISINNLKRIRGNVNSQLESFYTSKRIELASDSIVMSLESSNLDDFDNEILEKNKLRTKAVIQEKFSSIYTTINSTILDLHYIDENEKKSILQKQINDSINDIFLDVSKNLKFPRDNSQKFKEKIEKLVLENISSSFNLNILTKDKSFDEQKNEIISGIISLYKKKTPSFSNIEELKNHIYLNRNLNLGNVKSDTILKSGFFLTKINYLLNIASSESDKRELDKLRVNYLNDTNDYETKTGVFKSSSISLEKINSFYEKKLKDLKLYKNLMKIEKTREKNLKENNFLQSSNNLLLQYSLLSLNNCLKEDIRKSINLGSFNNSYDLSLEVKKIIRNTLIKDKSKMLEIIKNNLSQYKNFIDSSGLLSKIYTETGVGGVNEVLSNDVIKEMIASDILTNFIQNSEVLVDRLSSGITSSFKAPNPEVVNNFIDDRQKFDEFLKKEEYEKNILTIGGMYGTDFSIINRGIKIADPKNENKGDSLERIIFKKLRRNIKSFYTDSGTEGIDKKRVELIIKEEVFHQVEKIKSKKVDIDNDSLKILKSLKGLIAEDENEDISQLKTEDIDGKKQYIKESLVELKKEYERLEKTKKDHDEETAKLFDEIKVSIEKLESAYRKLDKNDKKKALLFFAQRDLETVFVHNSDLNLKKSIRKQEKDQEFSENKIKFLERTVNSILKNPGVYENKEQIDKLVNELSSNEYFDVKFLKNSKGENVPSIDILIKKLERIKVNEERNLSLIKSGKRNLDEELKKKNSTFNSFIEVNEKMLKRLRVVNTFNVDSIQKIIFNNKEVTKEIQQNLGITPEMLTVLTDTVTNNIYDYEGNNLLKSEFSRKLSFKSNEQLFENQKEETSFELKDRIKRELSQVNSKYEDFDLKVIINEINSEDSFIRTLFESFSEQKIARFSKKNNEKKLEKNFLIKKFYELLKNNKCFDESVLKISLSSLGSLEAIDPREKKRSVDPEEIKVFEFLRSGDSKSLKEEILKISKENYPDVEIIIQRLEGLKNQVRIDENSDLRLKSVKFEVINNSISEIKGLENRESVSFGTSFNYVFDKEKIMSKFKNDKLFFENAKIKDLVKKLNVGTKFWGRTRKLTEKEYLFLFNHLNSFKNFNFKGQDLFNGNYNDFVLELQKSLQKTDLTFPKDDKKYRKIIEIKKELEDSKFFELYKTCDEVKNIDDKNFKDIFNSNNFKSLMTDKSFRERLLNTQLKYSPLIKKLDTPVCKIISEIIPPEFLTGKKIKITDFIHWFHSQDRNFKNETIKKWEFIKNDPENKLFSRLKSSEKESIKRFFSTFVERSPNESLSKMTLTEVLGEYRKNVNVFQKEFDFSKNGINPTISRSTKNFLKADVPKVFNRTQEQENEFLKQWEMNEENEGQEESKERAITKEKFSDFLQDTIDELNSFKGKGNEKVFQLIYHTILNDLSPENFSKPYRDVNVSLGDDFINVDLESIYVSILAKMKTNKERLVPFFPRIQKKLRSIKIVKDRINEHNRKFNKKNSFRIEDTFTLNKENPSGEIEVNFEKNKNLIINVIGRDQFAEFLLNKNLTPPSIQGDLKNLSPVEKESLRAFKIKREEIKQNISSFLVKGRFLSTNEFTLGLAKIFNISPNSLLEQFSRDIKPLLLKSFGSKDNNVTENIIKKKLENNENNPLSFSEKEKYNSFLKNVRNKHSFDLKTQNKNIKTEEGSVSIQSHSLPEPKIESRGMVINDDGEITLYDDDGIQYIKEVDKGVEYNKHNIDVFRFQTINSKSIESFTKNKASSYIETLNSLQKESNDLFKVKGSEVKKKHTFKDISKDLEEIKSITEKMEENLEKMLDEDYIELITYHDPSSGGSIDTFKEPQKIRYKISELLEDTERINFITENTTFVKNAERYAEDQANKTGFEKGTPEYEEEYLRAYEKSVSLIPDDKILEEGMKNSDSYFNFNSEVLYKGKGIPLRTVLLKYKSKLNSTKRMVEKNKSKIVGMAKLESLNNNELAGVKSRFKQIKNTTVGGVTLFGANFKRKQFGHLLSSIIRTLPSVDRDKIMLLDFNNPNLSDRDFLKKYLNNRGVDEFNPDSIDNGWNTLFEKVLDEKIVIMQENESENPGSVKVLNDFIKTFNKNCKNIEVINETSDKVKKKTKEIFFGTVDFAKDMGRSIGSEFRSLLKI